MVQVDQTELEIYDGVSAGKYTVGLGQVICCLLHAFWISNHNALVDNRHMCQCQCHHFLLQKSMAFYKDQENVISAAMTATQNLMDKYEVDPCSIGRYSPCYVLHMLCSLLQTSNLHHQ